MEKKLVTSDEVMKNLGISRPTLTRWIKNYGFPVIRINPRRNMFDWDDINKWLKNRSEGGEGRKED
ncbi:hypothetical protein AM501_28570 [Aneurinibacillus migulanus]|uniref:helix-turn-helix transcriptional regulator n=1 Tax=Aneurinibacillus migulanus TaxID=47500 RepID=UPI0005BAFDF5|nr:helix-turn-helix domain-containing protein [Aneurinibacillus migulanus]KIV58376.1 hypothetical protein TS64_04780 [Aneurinibacillus migulanus]KPD05005.1 hypothetical protein AM501_28570 [Aneurinibacillus migulanus]